MLLALIAFPAFAHDPITTKLTWTREISRIVYARCATCHRSGGTAFSLLTYSQARPWAAAISEEVRERRMPPWGAVKGYGDFRNDQALTQEQITWIAQWSVGGAPEGDPKDLPPKPKLTPSASSRNARQIEITTNYTVASPILLDGIWPKSISPASLPITAQLPGGAFEPLVWLSGYDARYAHPFLLRTPLPLPAGTVIRGVPAGSRVTLLVVPQSSEPPRRSARYLPRPSAGTAPRAGTSARAGKSD